MSQAVLLVNLGSPDSTAIPHVKKYLDQFLMDPHVLDYPRWLRALLVRGIILNVRPQKSAHAYRQIWWPEGSPLVVISKRVRAALQESLDIPVALAMRYQNPSIESSIQALLAQHPNLKELLVVPLYPHYAMSTTETVLGEVRRVASGAAPKLGLRVLAPFYDHPAYIEALATVSAAHIRPDDHVLFSYHGVPKQHIRRSDPTKTHCLGDNACCATPNQAHMFCYRHQCSRTTELLVQRLQILKHSQSFQSRLGPGWLTPFTDQELQRLPKEGNHNLAIICPAFVSDCLETLEEIAQEGQEIFEKAGGQRFTYVPCLNDDPVWIKTLAGLCNEAWHKPSFQETDSLGALAGT